MTHQSTDKEEQMRTQQSHVPQPARRRRLRALAALCVLGAALALAACGSSASGTGTTSASAGTSSNKARGAGQFAALRSCLQKQGITLPAPPAGAARQPGGPGAGAGGGLLGRQLPNGVSQAQLQAAMKKCGAGNFGGRAAGLNSASARAALTSYAACLRQNGINVPAPNTSGNGPVFNTKGIDTASAKFKAAQSKCQSNLKGAFGRGGAGGAPPAGAPNGGGEPPA
jgi:hypothetical protein